MPLEWGYSEENDLTKLRSDGGVVRRTSLFCSITIILTIWWGFKWNNTPTASVDENLKKCKSMANFSGPEKWSSIYPEAAGTRQSPIDICPVDIKTLGNNRKLQWKYIPENTKEVVNPGYCWKVNVDGKGSELIGGPLDGKYVLEQFHCHWGKTNDEGSEHTVNGKRYAGELHLVHWNSTKYSSFCEAAKHHDGLAVLGVFLKPGRKHLELDKVVKQLDKVEFKAQSARISVPLNPGHFLPEESGYYTYLGSLTTPPCSECVIWIVFKDAIEVSQDQLDSFRRLKCYSLEDQCPCDEFKGLVKTNFRPTLPLGQREIKECRQ